MGITVVYQNVSELVYGQVVDDLKVEDVAMSLQSDYVRIGKTDYGRIYVQFFGDRGFIANLYWVSCGTDGYWTQEIQGYTRFVFPEEEITQVNTNEDAPIVTVKLPTMAQAKRQAEILNGCFRLALKSVFTGNLRVASDGGAWLGEFSQQRNGKMVVMWYRLMVNLG